MHDHVDTARVTGVTAAQRSARPSLGLPGAAESQVFGFPLADPLPQDTCHEQTVPL